MPPEPASPAAPETPVPAGKTSSREVRDELHAMVAKDLLGPWDGPEEGLDESPGARYLLGKLGPMYLAAKTTDSPEAEGTEAEDSEDGDDEGNIDATVDDTPSGDAETELPERSPVLDAGKMWASSMGMSFEVSPATEKIFTRARWGRYLRKRRENAEGRKRSYWQREPVDIPVEVDLALGHRRLPLVGGEPEDPGIHLDVTVRELDGRRVVELSLLNTQLEASRLKDTAFLFQAELTATALNGTDDVFLPIDDPEDDKPDHAHRSEEDAHLRLLYRKQRRHARGRNVAVLAETEPLSRNATRLRTAWLPTHDVPATVAPKVAETPELTGLELRMRVLAELNPSGLEEALLPLAEGYRTWLGRRRTEIPSLPASLRATAEKAVDRAYIMADRIEAGIRLLTRVTEPGQGEAFRAFSFANKVMRLQRNNTQIARLREEDPALSFRSAEAVVESDEIKNASWRPFQLAFVLLNLPSLTDPAHPERSAESGGIVDLLFFPTGGGKTEAYLGLAAYTFGIRRIQGVVGEGAERRDGLDGVAVLMRYTLRLLTAQQFQRAAALVCAAEHLRLEDPDVFGEKPFRIGMWVGMGVTPNWYPDAAKEIADAANSGRGRDTRVLQTLNCPWCGEKLSPVRDLKPNDTERRIRLFCDRGEGSDPCPFSKTGGSGKGLPILTVDEEIYRYPPSLLIATVDKFAQLPWNGYAGMLFGRVAKECERHGYKHPDLDEKTKCKTGHNKAGDIRAASVKSVTPLRPPDLIIQDELHLISGALGSTVGLFESAIAELGSWTVDGVRTGPKIIASTATTKRAAEQVRGVFARDLAVFPPPVTDVADTFFSRQIEVSAKTPGRRYLGMCAHGVRLKAVEIRLAETLALAGQTLFDKYLSVADPYMTTVGYFSATRELAGMRRCLDDDVTSRIRGSRGRDGWSPRISGGVGLNIQELTSRINSADISAVLKQLEAPFDPDLDTTQRRVYISQQNRAKKASPKQAEDSLIARRRERSEAGRAPIDNVLATSMLQVGVDVPRFGLMVVTGQPKNTAEYIQATSRVGRGPGPGLVVTIYNWSRPRDLAHFEDFAPYHAGFYGQVEALSVTPYTRRSIDRTAAGAYLAAVRNRSESDSRNSAAATVDLSSAETEALRERFLARAERAAGPPGRLYLAEQLAAVRDAWLKRREEAGASNVGSTLGYTARPGNLYPLIADPDEPGWTNRTVATSMRETENEINLLLPGTTLVDPLIGEPPWIFPDDSDSTGEDT